MAEIPLDSAAANRFISSLSKSLQALCHGCMDFDSGIEIGGYIYVSVDRGSKVDYVLNEMVQKSDNNSMKFISNSYLSRKDKQKQTRDGSCSPVLELQGQSFPMSGYQKNSYQHSGVQQYRSGYPFSSPVSRGAQKRTWTGVEREWRGHRKHSRGARHYNSVSASQTSHSSNIPPSQSTFIQPEIPHTNDINVKTELFSNDEQLGGEASLSRKNTDQETGGINPDNSASDCALNIKSDPDAIPENDEGDLNGSNANTDPNDESSDNNFLQSSSVDIQQKDPEELSQSTSHAEGQLPPIDPLSSGQALSEVPSGSEQTVDHYDNTLPIQFDQAGGNMAYGQPYSEQGDTSVDETGTGFDVIEIDDEDEDMQAMFGDNQECGTGLQKQDSYPDIIVPGPSLPPMELAEVFGEHQTSTSKIFQCPWCPQKLHREFLKQHVSSKHGRRMPYSCLICNKGFFTYSGIYKHNFTHEGRKFTCSICDSKFNQKGHLKRHLRNVHALMQCSECSGLFAEGREFEQHVLIGHGDANVHCLSNRQRP